MGYLICLDLFNGGGGYWSRDKDMSKFFWAARIGARGSVWLRGIFGAGSGFRAGWCFAGGRGVPLLSFRSLLLVLAGFLFWWGTGH